MNLRKIYYLLSPQLRLLARRMYYMPLDLLDTVRGSKTSLIPPRGMIFTGPGDFIAIGNRHLEYFKKYGNLLPSDNVLDVGSGIGRMAIPLTGYLTTGRYEGFDIVRKGVDWCRKNITAKYPDFRFTHVSLKNDLYSSSGSNATAFVFPYPDESFDFVFLTSVFTHLVPEETEHYMKEIARVMRKGGRCLATFFILNDESERYMNSIGTFRFVHQRGHYSLMDEKVASANVAYREPYIISELAEKNNLRIQFTGYGRWSGRPKESAVDYQDIVVFSKT